MTDNEIIKALERCPEILSVVDCKKCPLNKGKYGCVRFALDLINRLKAENERLKQERDKEHDYCNHYARMCAKAKTEARKEFAERLKALLPYDGMSSKGRFKFGRIKSLDIDNLLKEMG